MTSQTGGFLLGKNMKEIFKPDTDSFNVMREGVGREGSPINHLGPKELSRFINDYYAKKERKRQRYLARNERNHGI